jgi:hypothetical protein
LAAALLTCSELLFLFDIGWIAALLLVYVATSYTRSKNTIPVIFYNHHPLTTGTSSRWGTHNWHAHLPPDPKPPSKLGKTLIRAPPRLAVGFGLIRKSPS